MRAQPPPAEPDLEEQTEREAPPWFFVTSGYALRGELSDFVAAFVLPGDMLSGEELAAAPSLKAAEIPGGVGRARKDDVDPEVWRKAIEERRRLIRILGLREAGEH